MQFGGPLTWLIVGGLLASAILLRYLDARIRSWVGERRLSYEPTGTILTPAEHRFHEVLRMALPIDHLACPKVRLADVIKPRKGGNFQSAFNRICAKHLDFVVIHVPSSRILVGIELDDRSHLRKDRRERDAFIERAMASASIPLLRVPVAKTYSEGELRKALDAHLGGRR